MAIITAIIGSDNFATTITNDRNTIVSDEPESSGGKDMGLSPMDLLASALGSCTCITIKMYANHKKWPLERVEVTVDFNRDTEANFSTVKRNIKLSGDLSEEQRQRLLLIATRCPIHQTITHGISINSKLV